MLFAEGGVGLDGTFDELVGATGDPVHAAFGGKLDVGEVADADPERGVGLLLVGAELNGDVDEVVVAAAEGEAFVAEAMHDDFKHFEVHLLGAEEGDVVVGDFKGGDAAPNADLEATFAEVVEHADFVDEAEGMVEGEEVDEGAEAEVGGALGEGGEEGGGGGGHAEAGLVVFGEVVGVEAGLRRRRRGVGGGLRRYRRGVHRAARGGRRGRRLARSRGFLSVSQAAARTGREYRRRCGLGNG